MKKVLYLTKVSFRNEGKIKTFPTKQKLREYITDTPKRNAERSSSS